jgi:hypothetical protein
MWFRAGGQAVLNEPGFFATGGVAYLHDHQGFPFILGRNAIAFNPRHASPKIKEGAKVILTVVVRRPIIRQGIKIFAGRLWR